MKAMTQLATLTLAIGAAVLMSACGKTSNSGSTTASTPTAPAATTTCTLQADNSFRNSTGLCSQGTFTCPAGGQYTDQSGTHTCTAGQQVNINNNYPYPGNFPPNGCDGYTQQYHSLYIPMILNADGTGPKYWCVNYEWLNQYAYGTSYYNNYDYYYNYPPYQQQQGSSCGTAVAISYGNFSGAVCF